MKDKIALMMMNFPEGGKYKVRIDPTGVVTFTIKETNTSHEYGPDVPASAIAMVLMSHGFTADEEVAELLGV